MPTTSTQPTVPVSDGGQLITAASVARSAYIHPRTRHFPLTDRHGFTYQGRTAERVLAALGRADITPTLPDRVHHVAYGLLVALTDEHMPNDSAVALLARTPYQLAALVAYLCAVVDADQSEAITEWVHRHHAYLAALPSIPNPQRSYPVPLEPVMVACTPAPTATLIASPTAGNDIGTPMHDRRTQIRVRVIHSMTVEWITVTDIPVPPDRVNTFLSDPADLWSYVDEDWSMFNKQCRWRDAATIADSLDDVTVVGPATPLTYPKPTSPEADED